MLWVVDHAHASGVIINAIKTRRNNSHLQYKSLYWLVACYKHIRQDFDLSEKKETKQYPRQWIIPAQGRLSLVTGSEWLQYIYLIFARCNCQLIANALWLDFEVPRFMCVACVYAFLCVHLCLRMYLCKYMYIYVFK